MKYHDAQESKERWQLCWYSLLSFFLQPDCFQRCTLFQHGLCDINGKKKVTTQPFL